MKGAKGFNVEEVGRLGLANEAGKVELMGQGAPEEGIEGNIEGSGFLGHNSILENGELVVDRCKALIEEGVLGKAPRASIIQCSKELEEKSWRVKGYSNLEEVVGRIRKQESFRAKRGKKNMNVMKDFGGDEETTSFV
ncbi:hypothetical protein Dimus_035413 [Dionaea muscipula]